MVDINNILPEQNKTDIPNFKAGDRVKVQVRVIEGDKERIQVFEGLVIAQKHGTGIEGTVTVRKIISGIGTEKVFPLHSPSIEKFEIVSRGKVRRAKLYYLRDRIGKKAKIRRKEYVPGEETIEKPKTETKKETQKKEEVAPEVGKKPSTEKK